MMTDSNPDIWTVIESVLNGNPTEAEVRCFEVWIKSSEENRKTFEALRKVGFKTPDNFGEIKRNIFTRVQSTIQAEKVKYKLDIWRYSAAASIAALFALAIFHFLIHSPAGKGKIANIETKIPFGQKSKVTLSDGTVVYLNAGACFTYPAQFVGDRREVLLKGEAYFEVEKDPEHPFVVQTDSIDIKVYGTHFNVKSYPEENLFETTLAEGSVGIYKHMNIDQQHITKLVPGQKASYNSKTGKIGLSKADAELTVAWKDNRYYFIDQTLVSITKELERNFNVSIRIKSKELGNEVYSGLFDKKRTVYQILDGIARYGNFSYKLSNDTIVIQK
jgi:transmembrane sensor